jgi:hypothetical protein
MLIELSGNVDNQRKVVLVNNEKKTQIYKEGLMHHCRIG